MRENLLIPLGFNIYATESYDDTIFKEEEQ